MLQQMRSFAKSWVASVFLLLVVGSFTLWGVADIFRGRTDTDVVSMSPGPISYDMFTRDLRNVLRNESQRQGREITTDEARKSGMGNAVLQQMIDRAALDKVTSDLGLTVGDDDVAERVRRIELFYGPLGTFDKQTFDRVLQQRNYSEAEFIESMRSDMARAQLMATVASGFAVPPGYAHALFAFSTELRAADYVVLTSQSLPPLGAPSDQALSAYIKAHPDRFSTPEYRDVIVATAGVEDFTPNIAPTDAQLHAQYDAKKSVYVVPEKRDVQQITFSTEAAAKAARDKIDSGTDFTTAASLAGQTVDDRGTVAQDDLGANGAAVFALPLNGVTEPLKNFATWVIMKVTKIAPGKSVSFDEAKPELVKQVTDQIAQGKLVDVENAYGEANGDGLEIAESAKKAGMRIIRVRAVDSHGLAPDGSKTALPSDPELIKQIFDADIGEPTDSVHTANGHLYAVTVQGVTPPKLKSLDAARADATTAWTNEQNAKRLQARAAELAAKANRDGNLTEVAKDVGSPVLSGTALNREKPPAVFSAALLDKIFAARPGAAVYGPAGGAGGMIVARVSGVVHPELSPMDQRYQQGIRQLGQQMGEDVVSSLAQAQRAKMGVQVNQKLLNQALGAGEGS